MFHNSSFSIALFSQDQPCRTKNRQMATLKIMFHHKNSSELQHVLDTHGMTDHGIDALLTGSTAADKLQIFIEL